MRLAFLIYKYFPYGGLQRDFARIITALQQRGCDCRAYCTSWQGDYLPGVDVRLAPASVGSNVRRNERFHQWAQSQLSADPVDGVIGFNKMSGLDVYFAGDPCYLDKALREKSWLYRLGWRYRHFAATEREVFDPASLTQILLISASEQRKFEQHYHTPAARMHLLPPGVARDRRRPADAVSRRAGTRHELGLTHDVYTMLFVGSGFSTKGLDRAITALASLQSAYPDSRRRLLVAGQDRVDRYALMARRKQLSGQVVFLGGRDDIADLMLAADVLVHPARSETGGVVLLEALVAGLPVVTTAVCGYACHIDNAGAGLVLAGPFSHNALVDALTRMRDIDLRKQCRDNGLAYAETEDIYSLHGTAADLIERTVGRKQEGRS